MNSLAPFEAFCDSFKQNCRVFGASSVSFSPSGVSQLLDLSDLALDDSHGRVIWNCLKTDRHFHTLILDSNSITGKGIQGLLDLIKSNESVLRTVSLKFNRVTEAAALQLLELKQYASIEYSRHWVLDLEGNNVSQTTILALIGQTVQEEVNLQGQGLASIPLSLRDSQCLELSLESNRLKTIASLPLTVVKLNLSNNFIERMAGLETCEVLEQLDLSYNKIRRIEGLPRSIIDLNLSNNQIQVIENLTYLRYLQSLNLENNLIASIRSIEALKANVALTNLILTENEVTMQPQYRVVVCELLPNLRLLDSAPLNRSQQLASTKRSFQPEEFLHRSQFLSSGIDTITKRPNHAGIVKYLKTIPALEDVPSPVLEELSDLCEIFRVNPSQKLVSRGDFVSKAYIVTNGKLTYKGQVFSVGCTLFGNSLITPMQAVDDVIATSPSTVHALDESEFHRVVSEFRKRLTTSSQRPNFEYEAASYQSDYSESARPEIQIKVQREIEELLGHPTAIEEFSHEASIEAEARNFMAHGTKKEFMALNRKSFQKLFEETPNSTPNSTPEDPVSVQIKRTREELKEEISVYVITLKSMLNSSFHVFTPRKTFTFKDVLLQCDIYKRYDDPVQKLQEKYGQKVYDRFIWPIVEEVVELTKLANQYKTHLAEAIQKIEFHNEVGLLEIKHRLQSEGLLPDY